MTRISRLPCMHRERSPLVLDANAIQRLRGREHPGQQAAGLSHPVGNRGRGDRFSLPTLRAVVPEDDQAGNRAEASQRDCVSGGPAGDDRQGAHERGEPGQRPRRSGMRAGLGGVSDDRGQGPVEVRGDQSALRDSADRVKPCLAFGRSRARKRHTLNLLACSRPHAGHHGVTVARGGA
jgi:hypothetical protein